jgi:hypothetical protein
MSKELLFLPSAGCRLDQTNFYAKPWFAIVRVMSESRYRDALALSENEINILMNFPCPIAFAIWFSPSARLAADRISTQIDAHFGRLFDHCTKCRC